jgi:DNA-binding CsgD family transcriptional regulator
MLKSDFDFPEKGMLDEVIDLLEYGLLVVQTTTMKIHHMNRRACELISIGRGRAVGVHVLDQVIVCNDRRHEAEFLQGLKDVKQGKTSLIQVADDLPPLVLSPLRFHGADRPLQQGDFALLVFGKSRALCESTLTLYARAHQLTYTEANVLSSICDGLGVEEIASKNSVKISTVRTQIKSIREKTQTVTIRELIHRLGMLPSVTRQLLL